MSHLRYRRVLQQLYPEASVFSEPPAAQALLSPASGWTSGRRCLPLWWAVCSLLHSPGLLSVPQDMEEGRGRYTWALEVPCLLCLARLTSRDSSGRPYVLSIFNFEY